MDASDLRGWVCVFLMDLVDNGRGGDRETIPQGLEYDRPAAVRRLSGNASQSGDQLAQRVRYAITIRFDVGITTSHWVWWDGMYLQVEAIDNVDFKDQFLSLTCSQKEAGQHI